jgi:hypothetical protein
MREMAMTVHAWLLRGRGNQGAIALQPEHKTIMRHRNRLWSLIENLITTDCLQGGHAIYPIRGASLGFLMAVSSAPAQSARAMVRWPDSIANGKHRHQWIMRRSQQ